jgi:uracil-DNA glycosylase family 4
MPMTARQRGAWRKHRVAWGNCDKCAVICNGSKVFGRGQFSPDVLFLGSAPGEAEDAMQLPFVGKSGRVLNGCWEEAQKIADQSVTAYYLNLVLCRTWEKPNRNRDPNDSEIENCKPRLARAISIVEPKAVVRLGHLVQSKVAVPLPTFDIPHPAHVVRGGMTRSHYSRLLAEVITDLHGIKNRE